MADALSIDFSRDYFDNHLDQHELNERLITWLIDESVFPGPINSIEDAEPAEIEILGAGHSFAGNALMIRAKYVARIKCYYVDQQEQDRSFSASFEIKGKFVLAEAAANLDGGDVVVKFSAKEVALAEEIELLQCDYSNPGE